MPGAMDRPYSLYDVLNVAPGASPAAIEAAYRALMKAHHPDPTGASATSGRAADINAAYSVLRNPARRADYDRAEGARRQALVAAQTERLRPRRRLTGWGAWVGAFLAVCLATGVAAQRFGPNIVPPRTAAGSEQAPPPGAGPRIPGDLVSEVLAEAARMALPPSRVPVREVREEEKTSAAPDGHRAAAASEAPVLRRREAAPAAQARRRPDRRETADDFLGREGFIY